MGFLEDVGRVARAAGQIIGNPQAIRREWALIMNDECTDYYAFLGDDVLESQDAAFSQPDKPLWLNMGYWRCAHTYPEACAALAIKLAETAELAAGDVVLDAGFGFGEQDLLWVPKFDLKKIIGVNVTPLHVEVAQRRVADRGLSDRIELRLGSATETGLADASVDRVVALESAFHFNTREDFFREAMRVLRPGGRLATADMLPCPGTRPAGWVHWLGLRRWGLPAVNAYDRDIYREKLLAHGFEDIRVEPIRAYVYPGINRYAERRQAGEAMQDVRVELSQADIASCYGVEVWKKNTGIDDYVLFSGRKPG